MTGQFTKSKIPVILQKNQKFSTFCKMEELFDGHYANRLMLLYRLDSCFFMLGKSVCFAKWPVILKKAKILIFLQNIENF